MKLDDKKKKLILLGLLVIISFFVWGRNLMLASKKKIKSISQHFKNAQATDMRKAKPARTQVKDWGRNPFTAFNGSEANTSGLQLVGIIYDAKERFALINDQIVHAGDIIGSYKVIQISEGRVIVNDGKKDIELKLER
mgnify:CR=1 FL=1